MKSKIQLSLVIMLGLFLLNVSTAFAQKSVELKYNIQKGEKYKFVTDIDLDMSFDAMGSTMTMVSVMNIGMTSLITEVENDEIFMDIIIDRIAMNQKIFGMEINYDSDDSSTFSSGPAASVAEEMNKIIGESITMSMDQRGNIKELDVTGVSSSDITNNLSSGNTFAVYPEGKVTIGESWETDIEPIKDSEMKVHVKYTLLKISRKQVTIGIEGTVTANEVEGQEINLDGTTVGEMIVDRKSGMLITSTIDMEMEMDIEQHGVIVPSTLMSTSITNVEKVN